MANPDQKTILSEKAYEEIKVIYTKFQEDSRSSDIEVKTILRELARFRKKNINGINASNISALVYLSRCFPSWCWYISLLKNY
tara:strand:- start:221 stop:469 length:249 start_codon:yes stop_codon:yes gene_type:complete